MRCYWLHLMLALCGVAIAGPAGATIITPVSVSYTGTAPEVGGINLDNEDNIVNGNGLSATPTDANVDSLTHAGATFAAPGNAWATTDPGGFPSDFFASTSDTVVFEFDLGAVTSVGTFISWGYHFNDGFNGNSISNVTLDFSLDGGSTIDSSQTINVPLPGAFNQAAIVPLAPTTANFITMTVNDNHFGNPGLTVGGGDRVGIAEIAFSTNVIPEPSTVVLLASLVSVGLFVTRRKAG